MAIEVAGTGHTLLVVCAGAERCGHAAPHAAEPGHIQSPGAGEASNLRCAASPVDTSLGQSHQSHGQRASPISPTWPDNSLSEWAASNGTSLNWGRSASAHGRVASSPERIWPNWTRSVSPAQTSTWPARRLINLANPINAQDAVTKSSWTCCSGTQSQDGSQDCQHKLRSDFVDLHAIDGVTPRAGDRILIKDQFRDPAGTESG